MGGRPSNRSSPARRGFTLAELVVVVALSAVLALGLSALVDTPQEMMLRYEASDPTRLFLVDRTIRQLDDDVRFARTVATPTPGALDVTRGDGARVTYRWAGPAAPLVRASPEGTASLLEAAALVRFSLGETAVTAPFAPGDVVEREVQVAGFAGFEGLGQFDAAVGRQLVDQHHAAGYYFVAAGLGADDGLVETVRVRLRRVGAQDLRLTLYAADPATKQPLTDQVLSTQVIPHAALPPVMSDVTLPLTAGQAVADGDPLFLALESGGAGGAAEVEHQTLARLRGLLPLRDGGFLVSDGGVFRPLAAILDASQSVFAVIATTTEVTGGAVASAVERIPTSVLLTLVLDPGDDVAEPVDVDVSFPVANNLAKVNR